MVESAPGRCTLTATSWPVARTLPEGGGGACVLGGGGRGAFVFECGSGRGQRGARFEEAVAGEKAFCPSLSQPALLRQKEEPHVAR